ncbi:MAG: LysE family transporter [Parachlamydiales bacterium]|nr:LysE family transporter [Parachlamydiales bacterium]
MEYLYLFLKGIVLGFAIAMPLGPASFIYMRHALSKGFAHGSLAALGASLADTLYSIIAAVGVSFIIGFLTNNLSYFRFFAGIVLIYLGLLMLYTQHQTLIHKKESCKSSTTLFFTTFLITLSNPLTILVFAAIYASFGHILFHKTWASTLSISCGIFIGSWAWGSLLSLGVSKIGKKWHLKTTQWMHWISGSLMIFFGIYTLYPNIVDFLMHLKTLCS